MDNKGQRDNTTGNRCNSRMETAEKESARYRRHRKDEQRRQPDRDAIMPSKQVGQKCCACQDTSDDNGNQEHSYDIDWEEHWASWIIANRHQDDARDNRHDREEAEADGGCD